MDSNEAKLLLQACRADSDDITHPAFAEALALVERDPELKAWWLARQAFDQKFSAKLQAVLVPADLRATIMAGRKIEQMTPRNHLPVWLAIAAVFAILLVAGNFLLPHTATAHALPVVSQEYQASVLDFLGNDSPSLGTTSNDPAKLIAWLKERKSPTGQLPTSMAALTSVGCQTFDVHGHTVSLICFSLATGEIVHLFVVDRQALANPPGASPEFNQSGTWSTASWSDDSKSYVLATAASVDKLKNLL